MIGGAGRRPERRARRPATGLAAIALGLALLLVAGCGTGPDASPTAPRPSDGAGDPTPRPTSWPGSVVEAVLALGTADAEIAKAGADLGVAAETGDLEAMWGAADGLVALLEAVSANIDRLEVYGPMQPLAAQYRASFGWMLEGARGLRDSITGGNAAGVEAGSQQIARGLAAYGEIRPQLGPLIEQALRMKRLLVR